MGYSLGKHGSKRHDYHFLVFVPMNAKIADISHPDTLKHTLGLVTALGETRKIVLILTCGLRISGTGVLHFYPNEGDTKSGKAWSATDQEPFPIAIKDGTQRLQYSQSVANDDWDLYCFGYVVKA